MISVAGMVPENVGATEERVVPAFPSQRIVIALIVALALHALALAIDAGALHSVERAGNLAVHLNAAPQSPVAPASVFPAPQSQKKKRAAAAAMPAVVHESAANDAPMMDAPLSMPETVAAQATTATPTSTTSTPSAPPALVEARLDTAYLDNPTPVYPPMSRRLGEEGTVLLRVNVGESGAVTQVALERSCGYPRLDEAARKAVAGWRFLAARRGEEPVASTVMVPVVFALSGRNS